MQKIISLFQRNYDGDRLVRDEIVPGAEWVAAGEGVPTRKWDGLCCLVAGGRLFKRYELKRGKPMPPEFQAAQEPDPVTGNVPGWLPVGDGPDDQWHRAALGYGYKDGGPPDGTYELCGPKTGGGGHDGVNPEQMPGHILLRHGEEVLASDTPRTFAALRQFFEVADIEGIVWHHPDGRMVKIKKRDFGLKRGS